jgi:hydroxymethylbilane synthase
VPIAGFARLDQGGQLVMQGMIASVDGERILKKSLSGRPEDAAAIGVQLAESLLDMGGREILAELYGETLK